MPQPLLPFDAPPADPASRPADNIEAIRDEPDQETLEAIQRLQEWLIDPRTGKPSAFGQEALDALEKALVKSRNGWMRKAEDMLHGLADRNGRTWGDDIPLGKQVEGPDCYETIIQLLDAVHERVVGRGR